MSSRWFVEIVPCLQDNYAYLVHAPGARGAVVVDPSEAEPIIARLREKGLSLDAIWCTHHHADHVGGVLELCAAFPGIPVLGSAYDFTHQRIEGQTRGVDDGESIGAFRVLSVPGHTLGAIAYVGEGMAFTGDTLFLAGCGRLFEGTAEMMHASLQRLAALDPGTQLYVGHEYTEKNLRFAAEIEPESMAVKARLAQLETPSVPGALQLELETNPFLRARSAEDFARLRAAKDAF